MKINGIVDKIFDRFSSFLCWVMLFTFASIILYGTLAALKWSLSGIFRILGV